MKNKTKHLIENIHFSKKEFLNILSLTKKLKDYYKKGYVPKLLEGESLAMIFQQPSTRTRLSFENAMHELGGHAVFLSPDAIHFGSHEAVKDTARILSSMCAGIMFRGENHEDMEKFASYAYKPVFNAMTYYNHPTQGICDAFTILEHKPKGKKMEDINIVIMGDSSDTALMAIETCQWAAVLGMNVTICSPKKYSLSQEQKLKLEKRFKEDKGTLTVTEDVDQAIKNADFVLTDVWVYYDYADEKQDRLKAFMPRYQVNKELLDKAPSHCKILHCLPAHRDWEITSEMLDHPTKSIIFQEAENRLHVERALLAWYLYPHKKEVSIKFKEKADKTIKSFIDKNYEN